MIEVQRVSKVHRRGLHEVVALHEISCEIPEESFTFILGPSGSGKSTLLYLLGALDAPTSGQILFGGKDLGALSASEKDCYRRNEVGFIFQNFNLISNLSALENVLVPFIPQGVSAADRTRARGLLERVGLGDRIEHRPFQLSGGEQQRVAIARALFKRPRLILADEPTGELDSVNGAAILKDLRLLCREQRTTVVIVTHEHEHLRPDDRVIRIRDGRVRAPEPELAPTVATATGAAASPD